MTRRTKRSAPVPAVVLGICLLGCTGEPRAMEDGRKLVIEKLQARAAAAGWSFERDAVALFYDSSTAVPGLVYYWGVYMPREVTDVVWVSVAADVGGKAALISTPAEWAAVVRKSGWAPRDERHLIDACAEIVQTVGSRAYPDPRKPRLYRGPESLRDYPHLAERLDLTEPVVEMLSQDSAVARLWMVESGRTTQYRCRLLPWDSVRLEEVESIPYWGLLPIGP